MLIGLKRRQLLQMLVVRLDNKTITNIQYLSKVWERARAIEREFYGIGFFSRRSEKSNFVLIATKFFLTVAIMRSIKLIFLRFFLSRGG